MIVSGRENHETVTIDLRQVVDLDRLIVLAFSDSGATLSWGGALVVETLSGARVDMPLDHEPSPGVQVAMSVYNVGGQLVLRAERDVIIGTLRDASQAYGFDRITWMDPSTPLN
jgi:hypothetical protein